MIKENTQSGELQLRILKAQARKAEAEAIILEIQALKAWDKWDIDSDFAEADEIAGEAPKHVAKIADRYTSKEFQQRQAEKSDQAANEDNGFAFTQSDVKPYKSSKNPFHLDPTRWRGPIRGHIYPFPS